MADFTLHEGFPNILLEPGMTLRLSAIDPATGLAVTGITASRWSIYGDDEGAGGGTADDVVPPYTPEEVIEG